MTEITHTVVDYKRNNNSHTDQLQNSFFVKTATDWNYLDTTIHIASVQRFKALVAATHHQ